MDAVGRCAVRGRWRLAPSERPAIISPCLGSSSCVGPSARSPNPHKSASPPCGTGASTSSSLRLSNRLPAFPPPLLTPLPLPPLPPRVASPPPPATRRWGRSRRPSLAPAAQRAASGARLRTCSAGGAAAWPAGSGAGVWVGAQRAASRQTARSARPIPRHPPRRASRLLLFKPEAGTLAARIVSIAPIERVLGLPGSPVLRHGPAREVAIRPNCSCNPVFVYPTDSPKSAHQDLRLGSRARAAAASACKQVQDASQSYLVTRDNTPQQRSTRHDLRFDHGPAGRSQSAAKTAWRSGLERSVGSQHDWGRQRIRWAGDAVAPCVAAGRFAAPTTPPTPPRRGRRLQPHRAGAGSGGQHLAGRLPVPQPAAGAGVEGWNAAQPLHARACETTQHPFMC